MSAHSSFDTHTLEVNSNIKARNYWNNRLMGFEFHDYFHDSVKAGDAAAFTSFAACRVQAPAALTEVLQQIAPSTKAKHIILLGALAILARKCSSLDDVAILTPVHNNMPADAMNYICPVRMSTFKGITFRSFIENLTADIAEDFRYSNYPLERILKTSQEELGLVPSVGMSLQGAHHADAFYGLTPQLLLEFNANDGLELNLTYAEGKYSQSFAERIGALYFILLQRLIEQKTQDLSQVELMSAHDKAERLKHLDKSNVAYPADATIVALFEKQVKLSPEAIAVSFHDEPVTYRELDKRATRLAIFLRAKGIKPNDVVGLLVDRSVDTVVAMLGIIKAGGAYMPIDIYYPKERIAYIIKNSGTRLVLTRQDWYDNEDYGVAIEYLDVADQVADPQSLLEMVNKPSNLCYVFYTSGTTGNPKGVMLEHQNVVRLFFNDAFQFEFSHTDVWTMFHSQCFDMSVWEMYGALLFGGRLVIIPTTMTKDPAAYLDLLRKEKVTVLNQTASAFYRLIQEELSRDDASLCLRYVTFGGEALSPARLSEWRSKYNQTKLINMYGITETTVHNTFKEITEAEIAENISNIGKPIPTLVLYILDQDLKEVPNGIIGELYVGGAGLGRGYINNEKLTRERFINSPFREGERLYKSGDLVRALNSGDIEYIGRIDTQVKIRGFRVELAEIESQLCRHEHIRNAAILDKGEGADKQLIAYYVSDEKQRNAELRKFLLHKLPDYMVPSQWIHLRELPVTPNGKLDKRALLKIEAQPEDDFVAPTSAMEKQLASMWSLILGRDEAAIGVKSSFFTIGGNSLLIVRLAGLIHQQLGVRLKISELFAADTIEQQVARIAQASEATFAGITPAAKKKYYPLSHAQKRLYFLHHFDSASTAYNMPKAIKLNGAVDGERLEQAFRKLISRHAILRTRIVLDNGVPMQEILDEVDFNLEFIKVTPQEVAPAVTAFRKPFNMAEAPLFRVAQISTGASDSILVFDIHHIISDGVSEGVIVREFMALYNNQPLPAPRLQYVDYTEWMQSETQRAFVQKQKDYWLQEFSRVPEPLELPTDFHRPAQKTHKGDMLAIALEKQEVAALQKLAADQGVSMYMLLLSIYQLMLVKLANSNEVVVGTILAGRRHTDLDELVGMFANTVAIHTKVESATSFDQYLQAVKEKTLQTFDSQDYPYEDLLQQLKLERNTSRNPLFDVFFVYQNILRDTLSLDDVQAQGYPASYPLSKFDLTLTAYEQENALTIEFEYSTDLFKKQTIAKFARGFSYIVKQVLKSPTLNLGAIELVVPDDKKRLLREMNFSHVAFPKNRPIASVFEEQVVKFPDNVAVEFEGKSLTYHELNVKANRIAYHLIDKGVKPGAVVALFLDRSIDMIVSILAVVKAGGTYLPIDIGSPIQRTGLMLEDCRATVVITSTDQVEKCYTSPGMETLLVDVFEDDSQHTHNHDVALPEGAILYLLYTSGTTGTPKGVMVTHDNLMSLLFNESFQFQFSHTDVWTMFHRYCFDFSVWEMYGALLFGGKLVLVSKQNSQDPAAFLRIVEDSNVTVLNQTPTAFYNFVQEVLSRDETRLNLRYVMFAGEKLNPKFLRQWYARHPRTKLINMYGITETTIHVTYKEITLVEIQANRSVIGLPLPTLLAYILDKDLNIVPQGFPGELYVGGSGVSKGYINQRELTARKFIPNPFQEGDTLYRSGDLVRLNDDGELEYLRRIDNQVQLKGFRIELGEIEAALVKYRYVKEAKVVYAERNGEGYLIAYYTADETIDAGHLRKVLAAAVPLYMIPSFFVHIDPMPLTVNGKVDLSQLPKPERPDQGNYQEPTTATELKLSQLWLEVLGLGRVGIHDNFFGSGGDSIMAVRLVALMNKAFPNPIKVVDLYHHQTIQQLSAYLDQAQGNSADAVYQEVAQSLSAFHDDYVATHSADNIEVVYPMSNIEKGMCFIQQKNNVDVLYYEQLVWAVPYRNFNHQRLVKAMELMCERHPALRTGLDVQASAHVVYKNVNVEIPYADLCTWSREDQEAHIQSEMERSRRQKFDLLRAPLWKLSLYKVGEPGHAVVFEIHHAISDGWSIATLMTELNEAYAELEFNEQFKPEPLTSGFREFITEELVYQKHDENLNFWKHELAGFKKFNFGIHGRDKTFKSLRIPLDAALFEKLETLAAARNTTVKNIFFAAYVYALRLFTYDDDLVVGLVTFNRLIGEDGAKVFGNFLNTIPVRLIFNKDISCSELLDMVDDKLLQVKAYDRSSLFSINRALGAKAAAENPILDTFFNFTNFHVSYELTLEKRVAADFRRLGIKDFIQGHGLFEVNINGVKNDYFVQYECVSSFIDEPTFRKYHRFYLQSLQLLAGLPESDAKLIAVQGEVQQSEHEKFNDTRVDYPQGETTLDLFDRQVAVDPQAVAAVYEQNEITFGELAERSNQLARYLQMLGVGRGTLVPICLDRSLEMTVGIVAILKAGGAYVPIDPAYPQPRKAFMLEDTQAKVLLTQSKYLDEWSATLGLKLVTLDHVHDFTSFPPTPLKRTVTTEDLAYVIYTSGTTGQPKGAMNHHAGLYNRLMWMQDYLALAPEDVVLQKTTFCFDVSAWELLLPLATGCKMIFAGVGRQGDSRHLQELIQQHRVTTLHFVPSMLSVFLLDADTERCASLKHVVCSGEELKRHLVDEYKQKLGHAALYNMYGPTEASIDVTATRIDLDSASPVNIGKPVPNMRIYIVDKHGHLQAEGVAGELLIGGIQVARGYLNRESLTREKFIEDKFSAQKGGRLYRTGDLARWLPDGSLEYLGRIDNQVKIRGYRIELGEIETGLATIPGVREAAMIVKGSADAPYLVAYYVSDEPMESSAIQKHLLAQLPDYMVPAHYMHLAQMPLSLNGKLDRKALPELVPEAVDQDQLPSTPFEERLAPIWAKVLQLPQDQITINKNFFELGGHSLNATLLTNHIDKEFGIEFPLENIFAKPTIKLMAEFIESRTWLKAQLNEGAQGIREEIL